MDLGVIDADRQQRADRPYEGYQHQSGISLALVIGFIGGLLPALRAARMPVTVALREA